MKKTLPMRDDSRTASDDQSNLLGRLYAEALRTRAKAVLASPSVPLTNGAKKAIAADLEALAVIAERRPDAFGALSLQDVSGRQDVSRDTSE